MFRKKQMGQLTLEYAALIMFVLGAFLLFQKYIARGVVGRWKNAGDAFGYGRIYDPNKTLECAYDYQYLNVWYNLACYEENCDCLSVRANATTCQGCINDCRTARCD